METPRTSEALLGQVNKDITQLLQRFENIVAYLSNEKTDINNAAVASNQLSVESAALTRAAEDLLTITRTLKEAWLFGKLKTVGTSEAEKKVEETSAKVFETLAKLKREGYFAVGNGGAQS